MPGASSRRLAFTRRHAASARAIAAAFVVEAVDRPKSTAFSVRPPVARGRSTTTSGHPVATGTAAGRPDGNSVFRSGRPGSDTSRNASAVFTQPKSTGADGGKSRSQRFVSGHAYGA